MSRKLHFLERNVSDKSCKVKKGLFTGLIILTLHGVAKVRTLRDILYFVLKSIMINFKISQKILNQKLYLVF